jgi:hypothetical protein
MDRVFDILERIRTLWEQLEGLEPKTKEYDALIAQIRTLSDEYLALIDAPETARILR